MDNLGGPRNNLGLCFDASNSFSTSQELAAPNFETCLRFRGADFGPNPRNNTWQKP